MTKKPDLAKMELNFEGFKDLAKNKSLSKFEKIGFPDSYRENKEKLIFQDIVSKLSNLELKNQRVLDIGPGCSELPELLKDQCFHNKSTLVFADSEEMLSFHEEHPLLKKAPGKFPDSASFISGIEQQFDVIICYSVFHYIFIDTNVWTFLDSCLSLLAPNGQLLIGDIPNISKRKRFFSSNAGKNFHKEFMSTDEDPKVLYNTIEKDKIDDSVVLSIITRAQSFGFDSYIVPQNKDLPMSNRRDDILILRP